MQYENIIKGKFISRPNRFVAEVEINEEVVLCHVKNTGRCKEILKPYTPVFVSKAKNKDRKTKYDLISAYKDQMLINIDSQVPNEVAKEHIVKGHLFKGFKYLNSEVTYKNSRFDLSFEDEEGKKNLIEIKGVTLEKEGKAFFPDAPTLRGVKHIKTLLEAKEEGYESHLIFVLQFKGAKSFSPNDETDKDFGIALRAACKQGLNIRAFDCIVTSDSIVLDKEIPVIL